ncbi:hypothetical protein RND81_06G245900 [Saponaria officinalis]|uniref:SnoaL-like domain-containing protein n=1 Tax=Saponaria officinalis TaxID=3572 RepID=A0AAW1KAF8_SAPOF
MAFANSILYQNPPRVYRPSQINPPTLRWQGLKPRAIQADKNHIFLSTNTRKYIQKNIRYLGVIPAFAIESDSIPIVPSLSAVVKRFYACINKKDLTQLEDLISSDCFLEDSVFPHSFQGKKEVVGFISQLVESMGKNVHFQIGTVCEGDELVASLDWHLEWKEDQIPFSRGCSIFQCSIEDDKLVIRKAKIITEPPVKPGKLALGLLKILTSLFDEFPQAAKWFLKSPQTIFTVAMKIYNVLFAPIINPVLAFYITLWKLIARVLGYIISILHIIAKFLNQKSSTSNSNNSDSVTD